MSLYSAILCHKCTSLSEVAVSSLIFPSLQSNVEMEEQQQAEEQQQHSGAGGSGAQEGTLV